MNINAIKQMANNNTTKFFNNLKKITDIEELRKISKIFTGNADIQPKISDYISELIIKSSPDENLKFFAKKERKIDTDRKIYETIKNFSNEQKPEDIALELSFYYRFNNEQVPIINKIKANEQLSDDYKTQIESKLEEFNKIQRQIGTLDTSNVDNAVTTLKTTFTNVDENIIKELVTKHNQYLNDNTEDALFFKKLYENSKNIEQSNEDDVFDKLKTLQSENSEEYNKIFDLFKVPTGKSANDLVEEMYNEYNNIKNDNQKKSEFFSKLGLTTNVAKEVFIKKLNFDYATTNERRQIDKLVESKLGNTSASNNVKNAEKKKYLDSHRNEALKKILQSNSQKNSNTILRNIEYLKGKNSNLNINSTNIAMKIHSKFPSEFPINRLKEIFGANFSISEPKTQASSIVSARQNLVKIKPINGNKLALAQAQASAMPKGIYALLEAEKQQIADGTAKKPGHIYTEPDPIYANPNNLHIYTAPESRA